jgi:hypothetical protein
LIRLYWRIVDSVCSRTCAIDDCNTRWALLRNPGSLSVDQRTTLAGIQATNGRSTAPTC